MSWLKHTFKSDNLPENMTLTSAGILSYTGNESVHGNFTLTGNIELVKTVDLTDDQYNILSAEYDDRILSLMRKDGVGQSLITVDYSFQGPPRIDPIPIPISSFEPYETSIDFNLSEYIKTDLPYTIDYNTDFPNGLDHDGKWIFGKIEDETVNYKIDFTVSVDGFENLTSSFLLSRI